MPTFSNPSTVRAPAGLYSHVAAVKAGTDVFYFAGQTGTRPDGTIGKTAEEQADIAYANVIALLKANDLTPANIA